MTEEVFRADRRGSMPVLPRFRPAKLLSPVTMPLWISNTAGNSGSIRALPQNDLRASLTIQNLSTTATLYFSYDVDASPISGLGLGPGRGIIFDVVCPQSNLFLYMDAATNQLCQVMEMSFAP